MDELNLESETKMEQNVETVLLLQTEVKQLAILLKQSEMKRKKQKLIHDKIMDNLSKKLLDFEANLLKEQKEIQCILRDKDQQIKVRENLTKALQTKLGARYCEQCGYPNAQNHMDINWEISISKPSNENEVIKTLPPLSLPVPNQPPNVSFMSNKHFRRPKSKLSPVAEESEVTFASRLRNVHADLNPERFHAALSASLQSVVENKILPGDESPGLTMPNNTAVISTPTENGDAVDNSNVNGDMAKFVSIGTQTCQDFTLHTVDQHGSKTDNFETVELLEGEKSNLNTEIPKVLQDYCANLSKSTLSLVNRCLKNGFSALTKKPKRTLSLNDFSDNLFSQSYKIAKQHLAFIKKREISIVEKIKSDSGSQGSSTLQTSINIENSGSDAEVKNENENAKLIQAIGEMVESVFPSVMNSNILELVKQGLSSSTGVTSLNPSGESNLELLDLSIHNKDKTLSSSEDSCCGTFDSSGDIHNKGLRSSNDSSENKDELQASTMTNNVAYSNVKGNKPDQTHPCNPQFSTNKDAVDEVSFKERTQESNASLVLPSANENDSNVSGQDMQDNVEGHVEKDANEPKKKKRKKKKKKKKKSVCDILEDAPTLNHDDKTDSEDVFHIIESPSSENINESHEVALIAPAASPSPLHSPKTDDINGMFPGLISPREDKYSLRVDDSFDLLETGNVEATESDC